MFKELVCGSGSDRDYIYTSGKQFRLADANTFNAANYLVILT